MSERLTRSVTALYTASAAPSRLGVSAHLGFDRMTRVGRCPEVERDS